MPANRHLTRRGFLAASTATAAVGLGAAAARAAKGANDRLSIGIIGAGGRGSALMDEINKITQSHNVEITAVCDVWKVNLKAAAGRVRNWTNKEPRTFTRFGELLALKDVDAVIIATPDFGHAPILVEALKAGKDVYVEKPMAIELDPANEALSLAREKNAVVQVGTQKRSEGKYRAARKLIAEKALGEVTRVSTGVYFNQERWARDFSDCKEQDVDWDAYLFNRPKRPFDPRLLRQWHLHYLCTNGLSGLWMAHYIDANNIIMSSTYPRCATAHGANYHWKNRETEDTFHALLEFPEGYLFDWGMGLANGAGTHFTVHGRLATLDIDNMVFSGAGGPQDKELLGKKVQDIPPDQNHMANWIECIRSRQRPNADIEYGHQHAVATIMAAEAMQTGRRHMYDPASRKISRV